MHNQGPASLSASIYFIIQYLHQITIIYADEVMNPYQFTKHEYFDWLGYNWCLIECPTIPVSNNIKTLQFEDNNLIAK